MENPKTNELDGGSSRLVTVYDISVPLSPLTYRRKSKMGRSGMKVGNGNIPRALNISPLLFFFPCQIDYK